MPSPFARALAKMDATLDAQMGEQITIVPMRNSDFARIVDNDRPTIDVVALVNFVDPSSADIARLDARVAYEEVEAEVRRALLPDGFVPRKSDEVVLLDRPGGPRYKIGRADTIDPERIYLTLSKIED